MIQGLYTAATGIVARESRQDVIANNVANAATVGFKRQQPVQEGFYTYFTRQMRRPLHFDLVTGFVGPSGLPWGLEVAPVYLAVHSTAVGVVDG